ncbi:MAG: hypothetical protein M0R28_20055 [Pigmentiphaga sp.]|nr:hypothetical protein [Pigmentiphaga sp.]
MMTWRCCWSWDVPMEDAYGSSWSDELPTQDIVLVGDAGTAEGGNWFA